MQTAQEIASNLKNLHFYSDKIAELAKKQFELDYTKGFELGINAGPGSIRFDCMAAITSCCSQISVYCDSIKINLETAIKQDKVLHTEEEDAL